MLKMPVQIQLAGLVAFMLMFLSARANDETAALQYLQQAQRLTRVNNGVWIVPAERRLRERQPLLAPLKARLPALEKEVLSRWERNRALWIQKLAAEEALKKTPAENGAARAKLSATIAELKAQGVEPPALGGVPEVRESLVAFAAARNELAVLAHEQREGLATLDSHYRALRENSSVTRALEQCGKMQRLGPASAYESELKELRDLDHLLNGPAEGWLASATPLYMDGQRLRVPAVLNERQPLTFTWKESSEPTVITAGMAQAAGLTIPATAPEQKLRLAAGRELSVREVTLDTLRFGRFLLHKTPAYVLPPEGEDLGSQIGPAAFRSWRVVAEPEWLRLSLRNE